VSQRQQQGTQWATSTTRTVAVSVCGLDDVSEPLDTPLRLHVRRQLADELRSDERVGEGPGRVDGVVARRRHLAVQSVEDVSLARTHAARHSVPTRLDDERDTRLVVNKVVREG
jgi:hypothetical protein